MGVICEDKNKSSCYSKWVFDLRGRPDREVGPLLIGLTTGGRSGTRAQPFQFAGCLGRKGMVDGREEVVTGGEIRGIV